MSRILLVDDEPAILEVLGNLLAREGRELLKAHDAEEALRVAEAPGSLEVALLDKNLPDRNGLELARALRAQHPDLEVILMTGYPSLDSAIDALGLQACDYVLKPILDFAALDARVEAAVQRARLKRDQRGLRERLEQSERQLDILGAATGAAAHDFNNLLTVILVNGELLLARAGDDERRSRQVRGILEAGDQSAHLVRELMRLAPKRRRLDDPAASP